MAKRGQPTKYNAKFHPLLGFWLAQAGLTDVQMADEMGVTERTINNWKKRYPEFFQSITEGKQTPDDEVQAALLKRALEGYGSHPPSVEAQKFWLKNRRRGEWGEKIDVNILNSPAWIEIQQALIMVLQAHPEALEDTRKMLAKFAGKEVADG